VACLQPAEDDPVGNNRPLRSAVLRMPHAYVVDRTGDLYVFKAPRETTGKEVLPATVIRGAADRNDLKVVKDVLLCTHSGGLVAYSLKDPAAPRRLGRFGPDKKTYAGQTLVCAEKIAFLIGIDGISAYDLAEPATPRYLGTTPSDSRGQGAWRVS